MWICVWYKSLTMFSVLTRGLGGLCWPKCKWRETNEVIVSKVTVCSCSGNWKSVWVRFPERM